MAAPPQRSFKMISALEVRKIMPSVIKTTKEWEVRRKQIDEELSEKIFIAAGSDLSKLTYVFNNEGEYDWYESMMKKLGYTIKKTKRNGSAVMAEIEW